MLFPIHVYAQKKSLDRPSTSIVKSSGKSLATLININNISMWAQAGAQLGRNTPTSDWRVFYPRGTSGVYLYKIEASHWVLTRKMMLLR